MEIHQDNAEKICRQIDHQGKLLERVSAGTADDWEIRDRILELKEQIPEEKRSELNNWLELRKELRELKRTKTKLMHL